MGRIRVALVNDYEVVLVGLAGMLRPYQNIIDVVELDANNPVETPVDIALYDTFAAPRSARERVAALAANSLVRRVVVYSWDTDRRRMKAVLAGGADAYLSKALSAPRLVAALVAINAGRAPARTRPYCHRHRPDGDWPGRQSGLTVRESEVLALITQGLSNQQIAEQTHASINTVKTYIRRCYRRIDVTTRPAAVLWAIDNGFRAHRIQATERGAPDRRATP